MQNPASTHARFWQKHPGLVWSNPTADDSVYIRAALLRPRFSRLLEIALEFGLERLYAEWKALTGLPEAISAAKPVERILRHIEEGFRLAAPGH